MSDHVREHRSALASAEKRLLIWMAHRMPSAIHSDHLTSLALTAMALAGGAFAAARWDRRALWLVVVALAINGFGDSLDGTLARVRRVERPRYGFYVDHVLDIAGATLLFGGLACSPFMSPAIALVLLVAYLLVAGEVFLAGAIALLGDPHVTLGPISLRLFDLGGLIAIGGVAVAFIVSIVRNTTALAVAEPRRYHRSLTVARKFATVRCQTADTQPAAP